MDSLILIFVATFLAYVIIAYIFRRGATDEASRWLDIKNVPKDIEESTVFLKEKNISMRNPVGIYGRPDIVFKKKAEGELIVSDVKSRKKAVVYKSDIIQQSVYRTILCSKGHKVSMTGYVRAATPKGSRFIRVTLMPNQDVIRLHERYHLVKTGQVKACGPENVGLCKRCDYATECGKEFGR